MDLINEYNRNDNYEIDGQLLSILLKDNTSNMNIIWATDNYADYGFGYQFDDQISIMAVTGKNQNIIKPRIDKSKLEQSKRIREKAEVFTPSWICNKQNNLVDRSWFGRKNVFNTEHKKTWITSEEKIVFPENKTWQDYVQENRLEITCGEGPYLASRYDTVTGKIIPVGDRIGLLDRKLRIVSENIDEEEDWIKWALIALKTIYGYDWQGDNILLARKNLFNTFKDYYIKKFGISPTFIIMKNVAEIISWNIWQMDGLKFVVPNSCNNKTTIEHTLFDEEIIIEICEGCKTNNPYKHIGSYCYIMNWKTEKKEKFVSQI